MACKLKPQASKQITRRIRREMDVGEQPHVIAMTASAMQEDRDGCQTAGTGDYVSRRMKLIHKNGKRRPPVPRREA